MKGKRKLSYCYHTWLVLYHSLYLRLYCPIFPADATSNKLYKKNNADDLLKSIATSYMYHGLFMRFHFEGWLD